MDDGWLTGYKCVTHAAGDLCSWSWAGLDVWYPYPTHDRFALRPELCGPLAVFDTLENARAFYNDNGGFTPVNRIYKCLYQPSDDQALWVFVNGRRTDAIVDPLPPGTRFADAVRLTRRVL